MKCQLILTIWIVCLFHQIHNKPLFDLFFNKDSNPNTPKLGGSDPATDQQYEDSYEPVEDGGEYPDDGEDTGQNPPSGDTEPEHPEKPITEKSPETQGAQATAPEVAQKAKEIAPSDGKTTSGFPAKPEEKNPCSRKNEPEDTNLKGSKKETSPKAAYESKKTTNGNSPQEAGGNPVLESPERKKQPEERLPPEQKAEKKVQKATLEKGKGQMIAKEAGKANISSPKQPSDKKLEKNGTVDPKLNQQNVKRLPGGTPAEKSKWHKAKGTMLISSTLKNNKQKPLGKTPNELTANLDRKQPRQNKREVSSLKATAPIDENVTEYVGSISDLLSSIGRRMDAFEDINKKPRPVERRQLRRDVGVPARSMAPQLGAKSLPVAEDIEPSQGQYYRPDEESSFSSQISPFQMAKIKEAEKLQKQYGTKRNLPSSPPLATPPREKKAAESGVSPKSLTTARSLGSSTAKSGTEDYEKFLARRARQLDEMAPGNQTTRQLPQRLTSVSGTFESIASQLERNIKSVSAVNKDATSKRASKSATNINARGPNDNSDYEDEDMSVTGRGDGDPCSCYSKYNPLNVVRRTAKKVVRVLRNGTNAVYDGVDSGIVKAKDIKDATKNDIIDPAVRMLPVVSPIVAGVVDAGDAAADGAFSVARGVVQGGRGLNDGLYEGVEKMLKKDKMCNCPDRS